MAIKPLPVLGGHPEGFAGTMRSDRWWIQPALTVTVLLGFVVYGTWAAFQGEHYYAAPYLSPFYSPVLLVDEAAAGSAPAWHALFGSFPSWWPSFVPASPALFILPLPGLFRLTCYYYRKAYYRAFTGSPPACGVVPLAKESRSYRGETAWLVFQNLHRFAAVPSLFYLVILFADAVAGFTRHGRIGVGVGSFVLVVNVILLSSYTLGCHSLRHLAGGWDDCMSCGKSTARFWLWRKMSWLNARHGKFAWVSLVWVGFSDVYVRLVSMGIVRDLNTWG
ncbi:MAG: succinate dehydrogenase [Acidobacteriota bacterium]|nr:succinate dehydrogenase [Acidobacteriota bacterium]